MKKLLLLILIFSGCYAFSQDTFSIVAVDTVTGEIGSAGASCIDESQIEGGALIISDVMAGRGAIHTQSYWNATNQQNAHNRMVEGMSPRRSSTGSQHMMRRGIRPSGSMVSSISMKRGMHGLPHSPGTTA